MKLIFIIEIVVLVNNSEKLILVDVSVELYMKEFRWNAVSMCRCVSLSSCIERLKRTNTLSIVDVDVGGNVSESYGLCRYVDMSFEQYERA